MIIGTFQHKLYCKVPLNTLRQVLLQNKIQLLIIKLTLHINLLSKCFDLRYNLIIGAIVDNNIS